MTAATSRLWTLNVEVTFQADDADEAEQMAAEIAAESLKHESVWSVNGDFEPEQATETVDV